MTALDSTRYPMRWKDGSTDRVAVYALLAVSGGDTVDLSQEFLSVRRATLLGTTVAYNGTAAVSGTVVTIPAGAALDAAVLTVYGVAAS